MRRLTNHFGAILALTVLLAVIGLGLALWYTQPRLNPALITSFDECVAAGNPVMESYPEQCMANGKSFTNAASSYAQFTDRVTSANKAFSLEIPRGWGPIVSASDGDQLMLNGDVQPTSDTDKPVEVIVTDAYGHDGPIVFMAGVFEAMDTSIPAGTATEVTIGKGDDAITGTRYAYEYPKDTEGGIGARIKGDRDYQYRFTLKDGSTLMVIYNVYASDPRNLIMTVDDIVQSIRVAP